MAVLLALLASLRSGFRSRTALQFEVLALRHQLAVYQRSPARPRTKVADRLLWTWLSRNWTGWRNVLVFVQPSTVIAWQRRRFRDHWARLSHARPGRPSVDMAVQDLIRKMSTANPLSLATSPSGPELLSISPRARILPGSMLRLLVALLPTLFSAMRSRRHLVIENLDLRQQLVTLAGRRHPDIRPADRVFWVLLRRHWCRRAQALAIVRPDTVVRWHRAGFRTCWNWLSRRGKRSGRPRLPREVRALIRRMASENPWGAPPIH